jgi:co-chaperonin GroES (HSP10)
MSALYKVVHADDPAKAIMRNLGSLEGFDIAAQGVLVATYERPEGIKTKGGIELPHQHLKEDEFQSRVGLVVKLGRRAFIDDEHIQWHGFRCDVGDWVTYVLSEGMKMQIPGPGGVKCRLLSDARIKMKIPDPDAVF